MLSHNITFLTFKNQYGTTEFEAAGLRSSDEMSSFCYLDNCYLDNNFIMLFFMDKKWPLEQL